MSDYSHPILAEIITLLEATGPAELKGNYHQGDILFIGSHELPMAMLAIDYTQIASSTNMSNKHTIPIVMMVVYDASNDINTIDDTLQAGVTSLYRLMERIVLVGDHYQLATDTIAYVLSSPAAQNLGNGVWLQVEDQATNTIRYGMGVNRRGPGIYSVEASMNFTAYLEMPRPEYYN